MKLTARPNTTITLILEQTSVPFHELAILADMSGHCHDEHKDHDHHGQSHAGEHDHSDEIASAIQFSLYQHINFDEISTLNEAQFGSGKAIVKKSWDERLNDQPELESDADEQLLIGIP